MHVLTVASMAAGRMKAISGKPIAECAQVREPPSLRVYVTERDHIETNTLVLLRLQF